jgi:hypothetical protein
MEKLEAVRPRPARRRSAGKKLTGSVGPLGLALSCEGFEVESPRGPGIASSPSSARRPAARRPSCSASRPRRAGARSVSGQRLCTEGFYLRWGKNGLEDGGLRRRSAGGSLAVLRLGYAKDADSARSARLQLRLQRCLGRRLLDGAPVMAPAGSSPQPSCSACHLAPQCTTRHRVGVIAALALASAAPTGPFGRLAYLKGGAAWVEPASGGAATRLPRRRAPCSSPSRRPTARPPTTPGRSFRVQVAAPPSCGAS